MENKEETKSVSMNVGIEDENEILELQQAVLASNIDDKNVARIIGKLQKLYELTKYNSNSNRLFSDLVYKQPYFTSSGYADVTLNGSNPPVLFTATGSATDDDLTPRVSTTNGLPPEIPF